MIVRDSARCSHERVLDGCLLCELLHPGRVPGAGELSYSIAHAIVPAGESTLPHVLGHSSELYYILEGTAEVHVGNEVQTVRPGMAVLIPPGARQYVRNTGGGDLVFLCIVSPQWTREDERLD